MRRSQAPLDGVHSQHARTFPRGWRKRNLGCRRCRRPSNRDNKGWACIQSRHREPGKPGILHWIFVCPGCLTDNKVFGEEARVVA